MVSRRLLRETARVRSWRERAVYHGARWAPLLAVAVLTHFVFPSPTRVATRAPAVGQPIEATVTAPFHFQVLKSDAERALEGEARASAARPVYRFDAPVYDSVLAAVDSFFSRLELAAQDDVAEMSQEAAAAGARLGRAESELLMDPDRRRAVRGALKQFLGGMLSQGVADAGTLRAEPSRVVALRRGEAERLVPRDSIL